MNFQQLREMRLLREQMDTLMAEVAELKAQLAAKPKRGRPRKDEATAKRQ